MTAMPHDEEMTLPGMSSTAPISPSREIEKREKARQKAPSPTTPSGENAGDILGAWRTWYQNGSGVPVPNAIAARLGKQVKSLIVTGYKTDEIKHGLAIWTVEQMDNPTLSPTLLDNFVWRHAQDTRAGAREWREAVRQRVAEFSSIANKGRSKTAARRGRVLRALEDWENE